MKNFYLRSTIAAFGLLAGTYLVDAQSAGGGSGAGGSGAAAGGAAGAASAGAAGGSVGQGAGGNVGARGGTGTPARMGGLNTVGGTGIAQPDVNRQGAASILQANPNTVGGTLQSGGITAPAPTPGPNEVTPGGTIGANAGQGQGQANLNNFPAQVRTTLQGLSANGTLGGVTQQATPNGTVFRATITQNGVPMEVQVAPNGRILSRTMLTGDISAQGPANAALANTGVGGVGTAQGTLGNVAGTGQLGAIGAIPGTAVVFEQLPATVQETLRTQTAGGRITGMTQVQTPNGMGYLVTFDQNGRPMTMLVGADGTPATGVGSGGTGNAAPAATGTGTSAPAPTNPAPTTNVTERVSLRIDELPDEIEGVLQERAPNARVRFITRERRPTGDVYEVGFVANDRYAVLEVAENGKIIRDSRDVSVVAVGRTEAKSDKPLEGLPMEQVPVAIRNAIRAYATAGDVRTVTLGADKDGKAVYDVIFYRDGRRDRMIIAKDGSLVRIEENVAPNLEIATPHQKAVIAVGDLPQEVQDTIRRQTDHVMIKEIITKELGDETVYQVTYETNGAPVQLLVGTDGAMVYPEGALETGNTGDALPAPLPAEEAEVIRTVEATEADPDVLSVEASGTAAPAERGVRQSENEPETDSEAPVQKITLSDVPVPVQNTAKKLSGTGIIESINPRVQEDGVRYEITFMEQGEKRTVLVNKDGLVQNEPASEETEISAP